MSPGETLQRLIDERGTKKQWVAEQLGVGRDRVRRLCTGEVELTVREAEQLGRTFNVPIETFSYGMAADTTPTGGPLVIEHDEAGAA